MDEPFVSVVLATRNRQEFVALALRYYHWQRYDSRELIIVDDSDHPWLPPQLGGEGIRYLYLSSPTPLGTKLNVGIKESAGDLILKMDDDDFYAPNFLYQMVRAYREAHRSNSIAFLQPFLFFNLKSWRLLVSDNDRCSGATLLFSRALWKKVPFRDLPNEVDGWFLLDHMDGTENGDCFIPVVARESFLQVRHGPHLWMCMPDGKPVETYLEELVPYHKRPEDILPHWACKRYLKLRDKLSLQPP